MSMAAGNISGGGFSSELFNGVATRLDSASKMPWTYAVTFRNDISDCFILLRDLAVTPCPALVFFRQIPSLPGNAVDTIAQVDVILSPVYIKASRAACNSTSNDPRQCMEFSQPYLKTKLVLVTSLTAGKRAADMFVISTDDLFTPYASRRTM